MMWQTQTTIEYPFALRPASIEEAGLFYSQMDEAEDAVLGTVGHIRMDFGASGKEFYHTWWPHNGDQFNTGEFKDELQKFVDMLRADGPLTNLASMRNYCYQHGGIVAGMICERIGAKCKEVWPEQAAYQIPRLLQQYQNDLHWGRFEQAMDRMETMSALALSVVLRECRQMGTILTEEQGALFLQSRIHPHQNRGSLKTRATEIDMEFQSVLAKDAVEGVRTEVEKKAAASAWLELAISCAKVPVKYEADELKRQQKEEKVQRETSQAMA